MNSVVLIGRLTRDPEVRYISESQMAVATFTLAIDRPASAVGIAKQRRLITTAQHYLASYPCELQPRFDVVEIYAPEGMQTKRPKLILLENAFE